MTPKGTTMHDSASAKRSRHGWSPTLPIALAALTWTAAATASDHADPIDPFNKERQEGGITDLFFFPVFKDDKPAFPFVRKAGLPLGDTLADVARTPLTAAQLKEIDAYVIVFCVRRQLTDRGTLKLEPYTYRIHLDPDCPIEVATQADVDAERKGVYGGAAGSSGYGNVMAKDEMKRPTLVESFARYGGRIPDPSRIAATAVIEIKLNDQAGFQPGYPQYSGPAAAGWSKSTDIKTASGVYDDPFIFPAFFGTNVVGIAFRIPADLMPSSNHLLIWATSHRGEKQLDHVGRSLRTQNPRFELLNTLHPSKHAEAVHAEHHDPSLMRDLALRFNFNDNFGYRKWDFVPDVMCYSKDVPIGFPNGRLLTDDVAAMLAQYGDVLLYELSYQHNNGAWPRQQRNDRDKDDVPGAGRFKEAFPYLLDPLPDRPQPPPPSLSSSNQWKLVGIAAAILAFFVLENWIVAWLYHRWKSRRRYL